MLLDLEDVLDESVDVLATKLNQRFLLDLDVEFKELPLQILLAARVGQGSQPTHLVAW